MMPVYHERFASELFDLRLTGILDRLKLLRNDVVIAKEDGGGYRLGTKITIMFPGPHPNYIAHLASQFSYPNGFFEYVYVNTTMTNGQIFSEILAAYLALQEHETLESFQVDGRPFISPHRHPMIQTWDFNMRRGQIREKVLAT